MNIVLLVIGETQKKWVANGEDEFIERLKHYIPFERIIIPDIKNTRNLSVTQQKELEGSQILFKIKSSDKVVLLDERGKQMSSIKFSEDIQNFMNSGIKRLVFVVGGPYGFSKDIYARADGKMSLSTMTFPHDLVRVIFLEQLYRAFTIIKNQPYHHE